MMGFTASLLHIVGCTPRSAPFGRAGVAHMLVFRGEGEGTSHLRLWEGEQ